MIVLRAFIKQIGLQNVSYEIIIQIMLVFESFNDIYESTQSRTTNLDSLFSPTLK